MARSPSFAQGQLDTALIQREAAVLFGQELVGLPLAAAAAAQTLLAEQQLAGTDPFSQRDGWRPHGRTQRRFAFEFGGTQASAVLTYQGGGALDFAVQPPEGHGAATSGALAFKALLR